MRSLLSPPHSLANTCQKSLKYYGSYSYIKCHIQPLFIIFVELESKSITSFNGWAEGDITDVSLTADTNYTVAVYLGNSGVPGSYRSGLSLPDTYDTIEITGDTYLWGDTRTTNSSVEKIYGQADICFVAN